MNLSSFNSKIKHIKQEKSNDCGIACLKMALKYLNFKCFFILIFHFLSNNEVMLLKKEINNLIKKHLIKL
jgi:hypothetical protein